MRDVELGAPLLIPCRRLHIQGRVDGLGLGLDFFQTGIGQTAKQAGRQLLAAGVADRDPSRQRRQRSDRSDDAIVYQDIGVLETATGGDGVHGRAAYQQVLGDSTAAGESYRCDG